MQLGEINQHLNYEVENYHDSSKLMSRLGEAETAILVREAAVREAAQSTIDVRTELFGRMQRQCVMQLKCIMGRASLEGTSRAVRYWQTNTSLERVRRKLLGVIEDKQLKIDSLEEELNQALMKLKVPTYLSTPTPPCLLSISSPSSAMCAQCSSVCMYVRMFLSRHVVLADTESRAGIRSRELCHRRREAQALSIYRARQGSQRPMAPLARLPSPSSAVVVEESNRWTPPRH